MEVEELISRRTLDAERWPSFVVDRAEHIIYANSAWNLVAISSGGPRAEEVVGTAWRTHIAGLELSAWYKEVFNRVIEHRKGERHEGDCNTPDRFRLFSNRFDPLVARGMRAAGGMLVQTNMIEEAPIGERYRIAQPDEERYRQPTGVILQCGGCRRVLVAGTFPRLWEFVPEYVAERRFDVSHGLCELCREVHYGACLRNAS